VIFILGIALILLLAFSAFFSGSETALFSLSKVDIEKVLKINKNRGKVIKILLQKPRQLLITILTGNLLVNIAASSIATSFVIHLYNKLHYGTLTGWLSSVAAVMSIIILIFGEITPKLMAINYSTGFALFSANKVLVCYKILKPIVALLSFITSKLIKLFYSSVDTETPFVTREELVAYLKVGHEKGIIEEDEKEMIDGIFKFSNTLVKEIMVPRPDMELLPITAKISEAIELFKETQFSRFPVYERTKDEIVGILYIKDILPYVSKNENKEIKPLLREPYFVPLNKKIDSLFYEFQKKKYHIAIVIDEYGGTEGLVTVEDILEEIVGEIMDEYDVEEEDIVVKEDGSYLVDAIVSIKELNEKLDLGIEDEGFETVGGFAYHMLGHIPVKGEEFKFNGYVFTIEKIDGRRIEKISIKTAGE